MFIKEVNFLTSLAGDIYYGNTCFQAVESFLLFGFEKEMLNDEVEADDRFCDCYSNIWRLNSSLLSS